MPSPNLAFILFSEQWFTVYGLVSNLNFVQFANLSAWNNAGSKKYNNFLLTLPDSTRTDPTRIFLRLSDSEPTCIFSTRHNTNHYHRYHNTSFFKPIFKPKQLDILSAHQFPQIGIFYIFIWNLCSDPSFWGTNGPHSTKNGSRNRKKVVYHATVSSLQVNALLTENIHLQKNSPLIKAIFHL